VPSLRPGCAVAALPDRHGGPHDDAGGGRADLAAARMHKRGWRVGVDGIYGQESQRVCRQFQAEKQLAVDGVVGRYTWTAVWTARIT